MLKSIPYDKHIKKKGEGSTFVVEFPLELTDESKVQKQDISASYMDIKGMNGHLSKPINLNEVIKAIAQNVNR